MKKYIALSLAALLALSTACSAPAASSSAPASSEPAPSSAPASSAAPAPSSEPASSEPAVFPTIDGTDLAGNALPEELYAPGGVTMVYIWATFCNNCISEMPDLGEINREYQEAGKSFKIIGITSDALTPRTGLPSPTEIELAKEIVEKTGADYLQVIPGENLWRNLLPHIRSVPATFFLNDKGEFLDAVSGAISKEQWIERIDPLLEGLA